METRLRDLAGDSDELDEVEFDCLMERRAFPGEAGADTRRVRWSLGVEGRASESINSRSVSEPE